MRSGLVDKLLLFVASRLSGSGPRFLGELEDPVALHALETELIREDLLVSAYINEP